MRFLLLTGEGFNTVLETVESSLGAPSPEEVAQQQRAVHAAKEPSENGAPDSNPGNKAASVIPPFCLQL